MLEQFNEQTVQELSRNVVSLQSEVSSLKNELKTLSDLFKKHQHGGTDGSTPIYNEHIRVKPGVYIQGGRISFGDNTTVLEIKSGAIETYNSFHIIDTEGSAASDELTTIDSDNLSSGQVLILQTRSSSRVVTIKDRVGNITLQTSQDFVMTSSTSSIMLVLKNKTWYEVSRSHNGSDYSGFTFFGDESTVTIASGVITPRSGFVQVDTEGAAASDNLDTITATDLEDGAVITLTAASSTRTVVCKDGTGNMRLAGDFSLTHADDTITLIYNGVNWLELSRSDNSV